MLSLTRMRLNKPHFRNTSLIILCWFLILLLRILKKGSNAANTKAFRKKNNKILGKDYLHIKSSANLHVYIANYFKIIKVCLHQTTGKHICHNEQHILREVQKSSSFSWFSKLQSWIHACCYKLNERQQFPSTPTSVL